MLRALWIACLSALLACGGKKHGADSEGSGGKGGSYTICDGSADIRLAMAIEGGQVDTTYQLTNPYGHSFVFVDGQCRYYASSSWLGGVVQGGLSGARAAELEQSLILARISQLDYHDPESCPDADVTWLRTSAGYADCSCGCDAKAPKGLADALGIAGMLQHELAEMGSALGGSIQLAVIVEDGLTSLSTPAWPLIWPLNDIAVTWEAYTRRPDANLRLLTGDEAAAVRMLRAQTLAADASARSIRVRDLGKTYSLFMREELPDGVQRAIETLEQGAP